MDSIYLVRHTTPAVPRGICYGQTDLDVTESFHAETRVIRQHLPASILAVYSSPLKRCALLAKELFPDRPLYLRDELMEIHCGQWEMRAWDDLPKDEIDPWMTDFVQVRIPGGESYLDLHARVTGCWNNISAQRGQSSDLGETTPADKAIVAHGGVIRSILCAISATPLIDSFTTFSLHYGCVIRVFRDDSRWRYEILSNPAPSEKEQHKPRSFYK